MIGRHIEQSSDWWKFSIWNRVMGSQPIRIQLGKILHENLAGNSYRKILQENFVGQGGGEKANLRKAVIAGNLAFGIGWWGANQSVSSSGKSCGKILQEILWEILWEILVGNLVGNAVRNSEEYLVGKPCGEFFGKILWEILVGKSCRKFLLGNAATNAVGNLAGNLAENAVGNLEGKSAESLAGNFLNLSQNQFLSQFWKYASHLDIPHFDLCR